MIARTLLLFILVSSFIFLQAQPHEGDPRNGDSQNIKINGTFVVKKKHSAVIEISPKPVNNNDLGLADGSNVWQSMSIGKVLMKVKIDENGNYLDHFLIRSPSEKLTAEAERLVSGLKFKPEDAVNEADGMWVKTDFTVLVK